ncbi:DNA glycosylase AlkZ-like family protein [Streptacidiphilus monticola]
MRGRSRTPWSACTGPTPRPSTSPSGPGWPPLPRRRRGRALRRGLPGPPAGHAPHAVRRPRRPRRRRRLLQRPRRGRPRTQAGPHLPRRERGWDESRLQAVCAETLDALRTLGAATGAELAAAVPALAEQFTVAAGKPYEAKQSAGSRVIRLLSCDNLIRRDRPKGGWTSSAYRWTPSEPFPQLPPADAKSELVRRWLASYGPGTEADLKWWTGWSLGDVRRALAAVGAEPVALDSGAQGFLLPGDDETVDAAPTAALLPALDPTAMGWQERDWYLDPDLKPQLFDRTGNIGPTVWWAGRVVGGWGQRPDGSVAWELLAPVPAPGRRAVAAEAERLTAFLGGVRVTPRFRTPLERRLAEPARPAPGNL